METSRIKRAKTVWLLWVSSITALLMGAFPFDPRSSSDRDVWFGLGSLFAASLMVYEYRALKRLNEALNYPSIVTQQTAGISFFAMLGALIPATVLSSVFLHNVVPENWETLILWILTTILMFPIAYYWAAPERHMQWRTAAGVSAPAPEKRSPQL